MDYTSLLFTALMSEHGIEIICSDSTLLRQKLYPIRKADPTFGCLAFVIPPVNPSSTLWIIKKA